MGVGGAAPTLPITSRPSSTLAPPGCQKIGARARAEHGDPQAGDQGGSALANSWLTVDSTRAAQPQSHRQRGRGTEAEASKERGNVAEEGPSSLLGRDSETQKRDLKTRLGSPQVPSCLTQELHFHEVLSEETRAPENVSPAHAHAGRAARI